MLETAQCWKARCDRCLATLPCSTESRHKAVQAIADAGWWLMKSDRVICPACKWGFMPTVSLGGPGDLS